MTPRPPADLTAGGRGRRFWRRTVAEHDLAPVEIEILVETCRVMDRLEQLVVPATTDPRLLVEERRQREVLTRLLGQLALPVPDDTDGGERPVWSGTSIRGRRAAQARWARARRAGDGAA